MQKFLTLEGAPESANRSRSLNLFDLCCLGGGYDYNPKDSAATIRAGIKAYLEEKGPLGVGAFGPVLAARLLREPTLTPYGLYKDAAGKWIISDQEREGAVTTYARPENKVSGKSLFDMYENLGRISMSRNLNLADLCGLSLAPRTAGEGLGLAPRTAGEGLGKFSMKRTFTPPRAVRQAAKVVKRAVTPPKKVRDFTKKAARYYGAAMFTVATGGFASGATNKIFGLKGKEQKTFDAAAKGTRIAVIATASIAGASAISASMSGPAAGSFGKLGASGLLQKGTSFLIKDGAQDAFWKVAATAGGTLLAQKFNRAQAPEQYDALPNDSSPVAVPTDDTHAEQQPPYTAGMSAISPAVNDSEATQTADDESVFALMKRPETDNASAMQEGQIDPEAPAENTSISEDEAIEEESYSDDVSLKDLIAHGQAEAQEPQTEMTPEAMEGEVSLMGIVRAGRIARKHLVSHGILAGYEPKLIKDGWQKTSRGWQLF